MSRNRLVHLPKPSAALALAALIAVGVVALLASAPSARAADETATADFAMTARSGALYKELRKPVNMRVNVEVKAPYPASPMILPLKKVTVDFPTDMKFVPKRNFPVCPDDKVGPPPVNLSVPPADVIARCPKAVLGNGTAELYLAHVNYPTGPNLKDPVLIVFNGGTTGSGLPKIKIYGYSGGTTAGIYMEGVLQKDGKLAISVPILTADSAVGRFDLNVPATQPIKFRAPGQTEATDVPGSVGLDKSYVQSKCSTGKWNLNADFVLGTRDGSGQPTSPDSNVSAPPVTTNCTGLAGKPRLARVVAKGPKKIKRAKKGVFRVKLTNNGTATAKAVKIKVSGKWVKARVQRVGKLAPGQARTVRVRVNLTRKAKRGKKTVVKFRASAAKAGAKVGRAGVRVR